MHPIERLRYVAHATGADPATLVSETAMALRVERHPTVGPLWWLCAQLLSSSGPFDLAEQLATDIVQDPSAAHLAGALSADSTLSVIGWSPVAMQAAVNALERADVNVEYVALESAAGAVMAADVVILEALACGPAEALCTGGSHGVASIAYCASRPAWLVAGLGTRLPVMMWSVMKERTLCGREAWEIGIDIIPGGLFTTVIGPSGVGEAGPAAFAAECAPMPELFRRSAM